MKRNQLWFVLFLPLIGLALCSCGDVYTPKSISFSSDGSQMAFSFAEVRTIHIPRDPRPVVIRGSCYVRWGPVSNPDQCQTVKIASYWLWPHAFVHQEIRPFFSPDGRHIAVSSPDRLYMIDAEDGDIRALSRRSERVSSLVWISDDEIAYTVHSEQERVFWRQKIDDSPRRRVELLRLDSPGLTMTIGCCGHWPKESWSPDGRQVVYLTEDDGLRFNLFDWETGQTVRIGEPAIVETRAQWKPDGSAVVCLGRKRLNEPWHAWRVDASGATVDLSAEFTEFFPGYHAGYAPEWTPDGKYLVMSGSADGGVLVNLDPFQIFPVGYTLLDRLGRRNDEWAPTVYPLPAPGLLNARLSDETDSRIKSDVLIDYDGVIIADFGPRPEDCTAFSVTPDGQRAVWVHASTAQAEVRTIGE